MVNTYTIVLVAAVDISSVVYDSGEYKKILGEVTEWFAGDG